ncbi:LuxR family transcriptional regulator [Paenacidovorax monticola]|uniref:LuxR family transcriptional regulator n=1 Tax=Paenacidovorax monticola TaxID=1926868 RepID=UPI001FE89031|nr:LuxR family transcriptional regulator [Paenacidovorax monticola]
MQEQARRIAGLLYDGVLSPQDWYDGMEAFKETVGCTNFHQLTVDVNQGMVLESLANINNDEAQANYDQHYALIDERVPLAMRLGQGQVMLDHEHFSDRHMSRSALYVDCLAPQGMKYTMGLVLRVEGSVRQYVGFMRAVDRPHFTKDDRDFALHLAPDVIRAAHLRSHASQLARHMALGLAALDALPQALVIVDAHCRIQYSNPAADRMLARPGAMGVRHGRLSCLEGNAQVRWQSLVAAACSRQGTGMAGALQPAPGARSLVVTVLPINARHPMALHQAPWRWQSCTILPLQAVSTRA